MRNVLIYFRPEAQRRVIAAITRSLAPGGSLFLGPAETLWQISDELTPVDLNECFCYRRKGTGDRGQGTAEKNRGSSFVDRGSTPTHQGPRIRDTGLGPRPASNGAQLSVPGSRFPVPGLLGTKERLQAAAHQLAENRLAEATRLVEEALLADPVEPAARTLEGLIHDISGRAEMAIASYRATLYLRHTLFQVRLLLADALRRLGFEERAQREYREVLALLDGGLGAEIPLLDILPLANREQAARRCRAALQRTGS